MFSISNFQFLIFQFLFQNEGTHSQKQKLNVGLFHRYKNYGMNVHHVMRRHFQLERKSRLMAQSAQQVGKSTAARYKAFNQHQATKYTHCYPVIMF